MDLGTFAFPNTEGEEETHDHPSKFSWRYDPEESFSDWKIELEIIENEQSFHHTTVYNSKAEKPGRVRGMTTRIQTVFHVHKSYLGSGDRRSLYFQRLFHSSAGRNTVQLQEGLESTSKIKLEESAALAFPIMLDYMYSSLADAALNVDSESAVALRWLSTYFGIQPMFKATNEFISDDLSITNSHTYLREAAIFNDNKIVEVASSICADGLNSMVVDNMVHLSPEHFSLVLEQAHQGGAQPSELLSQRVKAYCDRHRKTITSEMLAEWTDHSVMPVIASDAALSLLRHADAHNLGNAVEVDGGGGNVAISLHERCAKAAAHSWETTLLVSIQDRTEAIKSGYRDISDKTKVSVLEQALTQANRKVQAATDILSKLHRVPNHSYWTSKYYSKISTDYALKSLEGFNLTPPSVNGAALKYFGVGGGRTLALFWIQQ